MTILGQSLRSLFGGGSRQSTRGQTGMAPRGPKPRIGASIYRGEVRMTVQAGLTDELWMWLQDFGWRELQDRAIRTQYREVPSSVVTKLFDAAPDNRLKILTVAVSRATAKPTISSAAVPAGLLRRR